MDNSMLSNIYNIVLKGTKLGHQNRTTESFQNNSSLIYDTCIGYYITHVLHIKSQVTHTWGLSKSLPNPSRNTDTFYFPLRTLPTNTTSLKFDIRKSPTQPTQPLSSSNAIRSIFLLKGTRNTKLTAILTIQSCNSLVAKYAERRI